MMGIGIFLGLFFCGVIYLYTQTKDRWNWSKLKKITLYIITVPILLGLLLSGGYYLYDKYENRPKLITELKGVKLGDSLKDASFKLGEFQTEQDFNISYFYDLMMKSEKNSSEFDIYFKDWKVALESARKRPKNTIDGFYRNDPQNINLNIINNKIDFITQNCSQDYDYTTVNNIGCKDTGDEILKKFDSDVRVLCDRENADNTRRVYDVVNYGVRYFLSQNVVYGFGIAEPKTLESYIGINWVKCD
jgi:hypothetical protein